MTRRRLVLALLVLLAARAVAERWLREEHEPYFPFADGFEADERLAAGVWDKAGGSEVA